MTVRSWLLIKTERGFPGATWDGRRRRPAWVLLVAGLAALLVAAGCGSTHGDGEFSAALAAKEASDTATMAAGAEAPSTSGDAISTPSTSGADVQDPAVPPVASGSDATISPPKAGSSRTPANTNPGSPSGPSASAEGRAPSSSAGSSAPAPAPEKGGEVPAPPGTPAPGSTGPKSTIAIGSIGTEVGPIGQQLLPELQGARAWLADVNARGGLNGHPVRLIVADDGGDPNRALSLARRMADEDKVVAFYAERGPTTFQAVAPFLEERHIPVIGSCSCTTPFAKSPMAFEVGFGGNLGIAWAHMAPLLAHSDKRKASILFCREVATCSGIRDNIRNELADRAGVEIVHEAQVTLTQPDYTAEVLAARNAGAEAFFLAVDTFSQMRIIRSAHRQNYKPEFALQHGSHDERFLEVGGEDIEGVYVSGSMPHWTSPKLADFRAAMATHVPGSSLSSIGAQSWAAGKVMELIAQGFPDKPTSADFLRGLYGLRGETLGGLIPPLTYREGQATDRNNLCVIPMRINQGRFVPKDGDNYFCLPGE